MVLRFLTYTFNVKFSTISNYDLIGRSVKLNNILTRRFVKLSLMSLMHLT
jgi:hypothetical protein